MQCVRTRRRMGNSHIQVFAHGLKQEGETGLSFDRLGGLWLLLPFRAVKP